MMNSPGRPGPSRPGRGPRRNAAKERMWRRHVLRQAKGRRSVREYCAVAGISEPSFYAWRRELAERDAAAGTMPAQLQRTDSPTPQTGRHPSRTRQPRSRVRPRTAHSATGLRPRFLPVTISPVLSKNHRSRFLQRSRAAPRWVVVVLRQALSHRRFKSPRRQA